MKKVIASLLAGLFAVSVASLAVAGDQPKDKEKETKEQKK